MSVNKVVVSVGGALAIGVVLSQLRVEKNESCMTGFRLNIPFSNAALIDTMKVDAACVARQKTGQPTPVPR